LNFKNQTYYNCHVTLNNSETYKLEANYLHNAGLDFWNGWRCAAGVERISIDANLDVYGGVCENDYLGNLITGWEILNEYTTCQRNRCTGCTDDLLAIKYERPTNEH
jgi:hypothetical protein